MIGPPGFSSDMGTFATQRNSNELPMQQIVQQRGGRLKTTVQQAPVESIPMPNFIPNHDAGSCRFLNLRTPLLTNPCPHFIRTEALKSHDFLKAADSTLRGIGVNL